MSNNIFFDLSELNYIGKNVIIGKTVRIRHPHLVSISDNCIIDDFTYISGELFLGPGVHVGANCTLQSGKSKIVIDNFTGLSSGCRVFAVSTNYISSDINLPTLPQHYGETIRSTISEDIFIGKACNIGANSIILPGVNIPDGCSFGAFSKISKKKYESFSLYSEDCKKVLYKRNAKKIIEQLNQLNQLNCDE